MKRILSNAILYASSLAMTQVIFSQTAGLSLKHGTYVLGNIDCNDAPFAAMQAWNGIGFAGPHASQCTTRVLSHSGNQFNVSTACAALGNGTPDTSGYVDKLSLTRLSNTRYVVHHEDKTESSYRWCSAK